MLYRSFTREFTKLASNEKSQSWRVRDMTSGDVRRYDLNRGGEGRTFDDLLRGNSRLHHKIIEKDGDIAAFATYSPAKRELLQLWVAPKYRRQGMAKALMDSLGPVKRLTVRSNNLAAQKLYHSRGLNVVGPSRGNWGSNPKSVYMVVGGYRKVP